MKIGKKRNKLYFDICLAPCDHLHSDHFIAENDIDVEEMDIETDNCAAVMVPSSENKDELLLDSEDKSHIMSIVDFRSVPRNEAARQQARRELVIQMLIAESMTN